MDLSKRYVPPDVEGRIQRFWEDGGYFHVDVQPSKEKRFSMVIPPPNITSAMHIGNALQYTLHDIIVRYKRMDGFIACWFPGMDHAGIATQNVVEKELAKEGLTRQQIGREEFVKRVWQWKDKYGGHIRKQLKALGTSPDWNRERFTLDEGLSRAVREVFVSLYEEGKIYRGERMINWCPRCQTALSDIEVIHYEEPGELYTIAYPLKNSEEAIRIATTRPETMLGDTGVAVNPDDSAHSHLIGKTAILPLVGRELPIVSSRSVDPEFGAGILKVTPAHDPIDFQIGAEHGLEPLNILNDDGTLNENAGKYAGLSVAEGRGRVVEDLKSAGALVSVEPFPHSIGHCQRCDTPVEPLISNQWFVKMEELAAPAIEAVRTDEIGFVPPRWKKLYFDWMENIKDWCISRQLWWGHQIPVWYCGSCGEMIVSREDPERCTACGSSEIHQDSDVLDTWFSSALFPFSVMGWPESKAELDYFYPTSLLITGFDIIFFWVARMIMMGIHFMGKIPFRQVYFTPLIEDEQGVKMSSSRGNIIDPLEVKDSYGMDSLRFTLSQSSSKGRGMRVSMKNIEASRNFLNKIWNMARFVLMNLGESRPKLNREEITELEDRYILSRLAAATKAIRDNLEAYNFNLASEALYGFIWHEYCDWYLELAKVRIGSDGDDKAKQVLYHGLVELLKLMHPFVPFISEEIWQVLGEEPSALCIAAFPEEGSRDLEAEEEMAVFQDIVGAVRMIRAELNIPQSARPRVMVRTASRKLGSLLERKVEALNTLACTETWEIGEDVTPPPGSARHVLADAELFVPLAGLIDVASERARLRKGLSQIEKDLKKVSGNLANPSFLEQAPTEVVNREKEKQEESIAKQKRLQANIAALEE